MMRAGGRRMMGTDLTAPNIPTCLERLRGLLICPACASVLQVGASTMACGGCLQEYEVVSGVPLLHTPETRKLVFSSFEDDRSLKAAAPHNLQSKLNKWLYPPGAYHDPFRQQRLQRFLSRLPAGALVVDVGAGSLRTDASFFNFDIAPFPNVDVVGDAHHLPFASASLDGINCWGALEHVDFPAQVVAEMQRVLRPGGLIYVEIPFIQGYHAPPGTSQDFCRFTLPGLERLLAGFDKLESGVAGGPSSSVAWLLPEYMALLLSDNATIHKLVWRLSAWLVFPLKYLDRFLIKRRQAWRIASGFYFIGRKP